MPKVQIVSVEIGDMGIPLPEPVFVTCSKPARINFRDRAGPAPRLRGGLDFTIQARGRGILSVKVEALKPSRTSGEWEPVTIPGETWLDGEGTVCVRPQFDSVTSQLTFSLEEFPAVESVGLEPKAVAHAIHVAIYRQHPPEKSCFPAARPVAELWAKAIIRCCKDPDAGVVELSDFGVSWIRHHRPDAEIVETDEESSRRWELDVRRRKIEQVVHDVMEMPLDDREKVIKQLSEGGE